LTGAGAVAAGAALVPVASCTDDDASSPPGGEAERASFDPKDWASVRAQLPLRTDLAHFAAFVFATTPQPVADAIAAHRHGLDEDAAGYLNEHEAELDDAVLTAGAAYLGVDVGELATTDSTTMGLGVVYGGLRLAARWRHGRAVGRDGHPVDPGHRGHLDPLQHRREAPDPRHRRCPRRARRRPSAPLRGRGPRPWGRGRGAP
jgi:hypothetical protein